MKKRIGIPAIIALWAGLGATGAQAAEATAQTCVTATEASGLVMAIAPEAIRAAGQACAAQLPETALIRQTSGAFIQKYQAEADAAWPEAAAAFAKISGLGGKKVDADLLALVKPMLKSLVVPALTKGIKPKDCPLIEHIVSLLEPLPARNTSELFVTILQAANAAKTAKGEKQALPICPTGNS